ncbi:hypothetical protein ACHAXT_012930 [Thalassiosira profunda]
MAARKRAKGRERKAAKQTARTLSTKPQAPSTDEGSGGCVHGLGIRRRDDYDFAIRMANVKHNRDGETARDRGSSMIAKLCEEFAGFLADERRRDVARSVFVVTGADVLLRAEEAGNSSWDEAAMFARATELLEIQACDPPIEEAHGDFLSTFDATTCCERSLVKFYAKRTSCGCLDKALAEARTGAKLGVCHVCREVQERSSMYLCGGCEKRSYCGPLCQAHDWRSGHKERCGMLSQMPRTCAPAK